MTQGTSVNPVPVLFDKSQGEGKDPLKLYGDGPGTPSAAVAPANDTLDLGVSKDGSPLEQSTKAAADINPDEARKVIPLARKTAQDPGFVQNNLAAVEKSMATPGLPDLAHLENTYPKTAGFLANNANQAMYQDDHANLTGTEKTIRDHAMDSSVSAALKDSLRLSPGLYAFVSNADTFSALGPGLMENFARLGKAATQAPALALNLLGELGDLAAGDVGFSPATSAEKAKMQFSVENPGSRYMEQTARLWHPQAGDIAPFHPEALNESIINNAKNGRMDRAVALGTVQFLSSAPTLATFAVPPVGVGVAATSQATETMERAQKAGVSPENQNLASLVEGSVAGLLASAGPLNIIKGWAGALGNGQAKNLLANVLGQIAKSSGLMVFVNSVQGLANDAVDAATGIDPKAMEDWKRKMAERGASGLIAGTIMGLPHAAALVGGKPVEKAEGTAPGAPAEKPNVPEGQAPKTQQKPGGTAAGAPAMPELAKAGVVDLALDEVAAAKNKAAYLDLGSQVSASKVHQADPETHQETVQHLLEDAPAATLHFPVEDLQRFFQGQKDWNPEELFDQMGAGDSWRQAQDHGGTVDVPTHAWMAKMAGTEAFDALADHVKFDPAGRTPAEVTRAQAVRAEIDAQMETAEKDVAADLKTQAESLQKQAQAGQETTQQVGKGFMGRLKNMFKKARPSGAIEDVGAQAQAAAHFYRVMAERMAKSPEEVPVLFKQLTEDYKLNLVNEDKLPVASEASGMMTPLDLMKKSRWKLAIPRPDLSTLTGGAKAEAVANWKSRVADAKSQGIPYTTNPDALGALSPADLAQKFHDAAKDNLVRRGDLYHEATDGTDMETTGARPDATHDDILEEIRQGERFRREPVDHENPYFRQGPKEPEPPQGDQNMSDEEWALKNRDRLTGPGGDYTRYVEKGGTETYEEWAHNLRHLEVTKYEPKTPEEIAQAEADYQAWLDQEKAILDERGADIAGGLKNEALADKAWKMAVEKERLEIERQKPKLSPGGQDELAREDRQVAPGPEGTGDASNEPPPGTAEKAPGTVRPRVEEPGARPGPDPRAVKRYYQSPRDRVTETPAFKKWFGDSKVVDDQGQPLVVFHGTNQSFDAFSKDTLGSATKSHSSKLGYFFTSSPRVASEYAQHAGEHQIAGRIEHEKTTEKLMKEVDRLEEVAQRTGKSKDWDRVQEATEKLEAHEFGGIRQDVSTGQNVLPVFLAMKNPKVLDAKGKDPSAFPGGFYETIKKAKRDGFDGVILKNLMDNPLSDEVSDHYAVFHNTQVKSASGNVGTYDPANPNILFQGKPQAPPFYSRLQKTIESKMGNAATADQVRGLIKDLPQEERKWSGIDDFLKDNPKPSKADLLDFLRANQLDIKELNKGGFGQLDEPTLSRIKPLEERLKTLGFTPNEVQSVMMDVLTGQKPSFDKARNDGKFMSAARDLINERAKITKNQPKFEEHTLPGGENYREMLFHLPGKKVPVGGGKFEEEFNRDGKAFRSTHWAEPNILAHTRVDDRMDADGKKVLFVEEIQSDWHQKGRKEGYQAKELPGNYRLKEMKQLVGGSVWDVYDEKGNTITTQKTEAQAKEKALQKINNSSVPDAPFKKTWHEFVLKRLIREAAEKGYDKIAWTTGEQQVERYDLSKQLDRVDYWAMPDGKYGFSAFAKGRENDTPEIKQNNLTPQELENYIGKELAQKIVNKENPTQKVGETQYGRFEGLDLKTGGEGMKGFYDKIIPDFLNKFGKKYGAKADTSDLQRVSNEPMGFETKEKAQEWADAHGYKKPYISKTEGVSGFAVMVDNGDGGYRIVSMEDERVAAHSLEITPALRDAALNEGFSFFQGKGTRGFMELAGEPGKRAFNVYVNEKSDTSTFFHELGHTFVFMLHDLSQRPDASPEIAKDLDTFYKWASDQTGQKVEKFEDLKEQHHELFARGFEYRLWEGNVPVRGLKRLFDRFAQWLQKVYPSAAAMEHYFGAKMTGDMRGVYDRLLSTGREIEAAKKEAGYDQETGLDWNSGMAQAARKAQEKADGVATDRVLKPMMGELTQLTKEQLRRHEDLAREVAERQVDETPVFAALADLDGQKISGRRFAEKIMNGEGGIPDDTYKALEKAAVEHGFNGYEDLAQAIVNAPDRTELVGDLVDAQMARYAPLKDGTAAQDLAMSAIHTEASLEALAAKNEALKNPKGNQMAGLKRAREEAAYATQKAKLILEAKPWKDARNFKIYVTQERDAAVKAALAEKRGDAARAQAYRAQRLVNHALASEAFKNQSEAQRILKRIMPYVKRGGDLLNMPRGFTRHIDRLLELTGFKQHDPLQSDGQWAALATEMKAQAISENRPPDLDKIANETGMVDDGKGGWRDETLAESVDRLDGEDKVWNLRDNISPEMLGGAAPTGDLTLGQLRDLKDAVMALAHVGKSINKANSANFKQGIAEAARLTAESIRKNVGEKFAVENRSPGAPLNTPWVDLDNPKLDLVQSVAKEKIKHLPDYFGQYAAKSVFLETLCQFLDAKKEEGEVHRHVFWTLRDASSKEVDLHAKKFDALQALMKEHYGWWDNYVKRAFDKYRVKIAGQDRVFTREELCNFARLSGSKEGYQRLLDGFKATPEEIQAAVDQVDEKDMAFILDRAKLDEQQWPLIQENEMKYAGVELERAELRPITYKGKEISPGLYHRIKYDAKKCQQAFKFDNLDPNGGDVTSLGTTRGYTKRRMQRVPYPPRLDDNVYNEAQEEVIHDLAYRGAMQDLSRFLKNPDFNQALSDAIGTEKARMPLDQARYMSRPPKNIGIGERFVNYGRVTAIMGSIGFRPVAGAFKYVTDNVFAIKNVGVKDWTQTAMRYAYDAKFRQQVVDYVESRDPQMKASAQHFNYDIAGFARQWNDPFHKAKLLAYFPERLADGIVRKPLYYLTHRDAMEKFGDENMARNVAGQITDRALGTGNPLYHNAWQQGGAIGKALSTAQTFAFFRFNEFWRDCKIAGMEYDKKNLGTAVVVLGTSFALQFGATALIHWGVTESARQANTSPEERKKRLLEKIVEESFNGLPPFGAVARSMMQAFEAKKHGENAFERMHLTPVDEAYIEMGKGLYQGARGLFGEHLSEKELEEFAKGMDRALKIPDYIEMVMFNFWDDLHGKGFDVRDLFSRKGKK